MDVGRISRHAPEPGGAVGRLTHWPALDGLRAFAVLSVMVGHLYLSRFQNGQVGVDVFFVLSGFLITWLLISEHDRHSSVDLRAFYARRALRLLPALFVVIGVVSLVVLLWERLAPYKGPTLSDLPWAIFYIGNYNIHDLGLTNMLAHTWSLAVEEQFYLIWPIICIAIVKRRWRHERVALSLLAMATLEMVVRFFYLDRFGGSYGLSYHALFLRSDGLMVGCAIAFAFTSPIVEWVKIGVVGHFIDVAAVLGVALLAVVVDGKPAFLLQQWSYIPITVAGTAAVLVNLLTRPLRPMEAVLSSKWAIWIGRRSYGVYLWHWPIFRVFATVTYHGDAQHAALIVAAFAVTFAIVAVSWQGVERPFNELKRRYQTDLA